MYWKLGSSGDKSVILLHPKGVFPHLILPSSFFRLKSWLIACSKMNRFPVFKFCIDTEIWGDKQGTFIKDIIMMHNNQKQVMVVTRHSKKTIMNRVALTGFFILLCMLFSIFVLKAKEEHKIVAKINGKPIWTWELALAEAELGSELSRIPAVERRAVLVRYLMDTQLMADEASKEKMESAPGFELRKKYLLRRALRDAYFKKYVKEAVTEADARKIYDKQIGSRKSEIEVRASHILVKTRKKAEDILKQIANGGDFAKLAAKHSIGPSKASGGDLGYFTKGRMVKAFADTAFALKKGDVSQPVQTRFGWHVIKVADKRERPKIPFEVVKDRIISPLVQQKSSDVIDTLRKNSKVELIDPEVAKHFEDAQ